MKKALIEIDQELEKNGKACNDENENSVYSRHAESVLPVFKAMDGEQETVLFRKKAAAVFAENLPIFIRRVSRCWHRESGSRKRYWKHYPTI